jgi:ESCRT-II complex subunit VPS22
MSSLTLEARVGFTLSLHLVRSSFHQRHLSYLPPLTAPDMRRGAGLSGLQRHTSTAAQYTTLSTTLTTQQLTSLRAQLDAFRTHLVAFATAHRADIRADPKLRHEFQKMCAAIGIDPLAIGATTPGGGKWFNAARGVVGDILGMSDWQHELAVQIVDVCASTRDLNGGMIAMHDLISRVQALRTVSQDDAATATITQEDVVRSVKLLKPLNAGYEIHSIPPSRDLFIRSVPSELDSDTITLLGLASSLGHLGEPTVIMATGWSDTRTRAAFEKMVVRDGVAWVDEQAAEQGGGMEIWVPSACKFE